MFLGCDFDGKVEDEVRGVGALIWRGHIFAEAHVRTSIDVMHSGYLSERPLHNRGGVGGDVLWVGRVCEG